MTGTINGKYRNHDSVPPLTPAITALESVPFYADRKSMPELATMSLEWDGRSDDVNNKDWEMPLGSMITGPLPKRFGVQLLRMAEDSYVLKVVWDRTALAWAGLTRAEVRACCLGELLSELGSDLEYMLNQPVVEKDEAMNLPANPNCLANHAE